MTPHPLMSAECRCTLQSVFEKSLLVGATAACGRAQQRQANESTTDTRPWRPSQTHSQTPAAGFTLIELLVVISIIALLIGILLPSLASAREVARSINCASQIRQLALSAEMYADDSKDRYTPRGIDPRWSAQYLRYYTVTEVLLCPSDPDPAKPVSPVDPDDDVDRSFMFNGFDDLNHADASTWSEADNTAMTRVAMTQPSDTILFGEKLSGPSFVGYYVDIFAGVPDPFAWLEQSRHSTAGSNQRGGSSNYAFADASVRSFQFNGTISPTLLWALRPDIRDNP